jgi:hypothetical protein
VPYCEDPESDSLYCRSIHALRLDASDLCCISRRSALPMETHKVVRNVYCTSYVLKCRPYVRNLATHTSRGSAIGRNICLSCSLRYILIDCYKTVFSNIHISDRDQSLKEQGYRRTKPWRRLQGISNQQPLPLHKPCGSHSSPPQSA